MTKPHGILFTDAKLKCAKCDKSFPVEQAHVNGKFRFCYGPFKPIERPNNL